MENIPVRKGEEKERLKKSSIQEAFSSVPIETWRSANWPVITYASKAAFHNLEKESILEENYEQRFWMEIFNPKRFFSSKRDNGYNSNEHFLFILHSFRSKDGADSIFKAVTTAEKFLIEDPENLINYELHGKPCEMRGGGTYPTTDFWGFYDEIKDDKIINRYPIPDTQYREVFIKDNF